MLRQGYVDEDSFTGHEATLTTTLDQQSESTKVVFSLTGVPLGKEEELKRNIEGY